MIRCSLHYAAVMFITLVCVFNPGCGGRDDTGPPELHLGSDVCGFCKMIISVQNYAAACVTRSTGGGLRSAAYDDIGCLLDYQRTLADETIEHLYVTDYESGDWIDANQAFYIQSSNIRSPMASGLIASQTQAGAELLAERFVGSVMRFDELTGHADPDNPGIPGEKIMPATSTANTTPQGGNGATHEIPK